MKKSILIIFVCLASIVSAQETMKAKVKPLIENYLKKEPLYLNCIISDVAITNISIVDEKEKNKNIYDFYHAYRVKQIEQIGFIKGKADFIEQHCGDNKVLFKKYVDEINATLLETVPLVDSLWVLEDKFKTAPVTSTAAEYYLVTFNFNYTLNNSKVVEKNHRVVLTNLLEIIHHDFLNK
ncbi:MAG: hypothetical protein V4615_02330 [Bacteroidota bacterium]